MMFNRDFEYRGFCESQKDFWDLFSVKETAENKGFEKGKAQGLAQGMAQGLAQGLAQGMAQGGAQKALEIAANLKLAGVPIEVIRNTTGLTEEEISAL